MTAQTRLASAAAASRPFLLLGDVRQIRTATSDNISRSPDGASWKKINASLVASTLYSDSTVANGSTYYYAATAVDIYGHESGKATPVKVIIP